MYRLRAYYKMECLKVRKTGRKPIDQHSPARVVPVRIPQKLLVSIKRLAKKHDRTFSAEIRKALQRWDERHEIQQVHNTALGTAVSVLADRIEVITGKKWIDDAPTREVVRDRIERLVSHVLSPISKVTNVPAEIKEDADLVLSLLMHAMPRPGSPRFAGMVIIDDRGLANIMEDLARDLGEGSVSVRAPDLLVARREQKGRK